MNTYILFLYGSFEDREDIEFFCSEIFPSESIISIKYIIENNQNIIVIFDSEILLFIRKGGVSNRSHTRKH